MVGHEGVFVISRQRGRECMVFDGGFQRTLELILILIELFIWMAGRIDRLA